MANNKGQITDGDNVLDFLNLKNTESKSNFDDPITLSSIPVTLDQLRPYDHNPRTTRNPLYEEIRDMIEARGLDNPPNISRRNPDDDYYIIIDGGNTRLEILRELHKKYVALSEQTDSLIEKNKLNEKAQSFYAFECVFKPWKSESDALAGHMSENENRGDTKFIEKAMAVQKFRAFYAQEDKQALMDAGEDLDEDYESPPLSMRALSKRMASQGWRVSDSHLTRLDYASEVLINVIPKALWAGAGAPVVKNIRKHKKAYEDFWQQMDAPEQDKISGYFYDELHKFDHEEGLNFNAFIDFFNAYLADQLDIPVISVSAEINALVNNREINVPPELSSQAIPSDDALAIAQRYQETRNPGETVTDPGPANPGLKKTPSPTVKPQRSVVKSPNAEAANSETQTQHFFVPVEAKSVWQAIFDRIVIVAEQYNIMIGLSDDDSGFKQYRVSDCAPFKPEQADESRTYIVFERIKDDERAAMWWALTHISGSYKTYSIEDFINQPFVHVYQNYLPSFGHNIMTMILHLEEITLMLPDDTQKLLYELRLLTKQYLILQQGGSYE